MRKVILVLIATAILSFAMVGIPTGKKPDMRIGEILFSPIDENSMDGIEKFAVEHDAKISKVTRVLPIYLMEFPPVISASEIQKLADTKNYKKLWNEYNKCRNQVLEFAKSLENTHLVKYAQPNFIYYAQYTPDDPYFVDDGMYGPDEGVDQYASFIENVQEGWDYSLGSRDVLLCIIDSGVDVDHPDLSANIWVNPGEDIDHDGELYDYDDLNGIDDDGDGYVDDLFGYDFVGGNTGDIFSPGDPAEEDWNPDIHYNGDDGWGEPDPSCGSGSSMTDMGVSHGTHCAGIAGAVIDNGLDFAGGCGIVSIVPVRVMNAGGSGNSADLISGVEYAAIIGADVASMSFGGMMGTVDTALVEACQYAYLRGVALIAASGNEGTEGVSSPASSQYTLAVGSFNSDLQRSWFSNYGTTLDVLAGGGDATSDGWTTTYTEVIWSTWVRSVYEADSTGGTPGEHTLAGEAGTSMACPQAAGLAALIKSALPDISPDSVYNIIRNTAQDIGTPGWDIETGYGIIDYGAAMTAIYHHTKTEFRHPENTDMISSCVDEFVCGIIDSPMDITGVEMEIDGISVPVSFVDDSFFCDDSLLRTEGEHHICITSIMSADSGEVLSYPICRDFIIDFSPPYLTEIEPAPDTIYPSLHPDIIVMIEDEFSRPNTDSIFFIIDGINYTPDSLDSNNHRAIFRSASHSMGWEDGDTVIVCLQCQDVTDYCAPNILSTCWSFTVINSGISSKIPKSFDISVYPNPTNPAGVIKLSLPEQDNISVDIFDISGRFVSNIYNGWLDGGIHSFKIPKNLPSGKYTIIATGKTFSRTTTIAIIK